MRKQTKSRIVDLEGVCLHRQATPILQDISWTIKKDQHCALIGPNGSGKTTLLKVITGYEWPTSGIVKVLGKRYGECNLPELRRAIGWVSSALTGRVPKRDSAIEVVLSGLDVSFGLWREYSNEEIQAARVALSNLSMEYAVDRTFEVLSQGERQRVLIARSLIANPELLILDEACAGLDPVARQSFLDDLGMLSARPDAPTLIFVTHHIEEISSWISDIVLLADGRIQSSGLKQSVLTSGNLSQAFKRPCRVEIQGGSYYLFPDGK